MTRPGILAVWNDRDEALDEFYEDWYVYQHFPERVGLPGWLYGRRFEAADGGSPRFFTYYRTTDPAALTSPEYVERLNDPTPETVTVMQHWRNMTRTCCELQLECGHACGAYAVVVRFYDAVDVEALNDAARAVWAAHGRKAGLRSSRLLRVQCWAIDAAGVRDSAEAGVRDGDDAVVQAAAVFEVMRDADARRMVESVDATFDAGGLGGGQVGCYRFLCEFRAEPGT